MKETARKAEIEEEVHDLHTHLISTGDVKFHYSNIFFTLMSCIQMDILILVSHFTIAPEPLIAAMCSSLLPSADPHGDP